MDELDLLKGLVSVPSVSGDEGAAARWLVAQMKALGLRAQVDGAGNAVGERCIPNEAGQVTRTIVLLGHIDTVPGEVVVRVENGRLYGRGTVDAKGPLATFVLAAARARLMAGTRLVVVGAVEEESATSKGARFVATQYQPDICIIGEPSGWDGVTLGYKGRLLLDYELRQPMSHTAGEQRGVGETAVSWWNVIDQFAQTFNAERERLFDQLLPSIREMQTGSDGLTNWATLKVGVRLPPAFDVVGFVAQAREWAGVATMRDYAYEPAFQGERRSGLARAFRVALRQAGATPRFKLKTGTSDMNVVGPIWHCPIVAYGPGDSSLDHTPDEHVAIVDFERAVGVLKNVLEILD